MSLKMLKLIGLLSLVMSAIPSELQAKNLGREISSVYEDDLDFNESDPEPMFNHFERVQEEAAQESVTT